MLPNGTIEFLSVDTKLYLQVILNLPRTHFPFNGFFLFSLAFDKFVIVI